MVGRRDTQVAVALLAIGLLVSPWLVTVPAGTRIAVEADGAFDPTEGVHRHDHWDDRQKVTLIDRRIQTPWAADTIPTPGPSDVTSPWVTFDVPARFGPEGTRVPWMVFEGTTRIDVTLAWEGRPTDPKRLCLTHTGTSPDANYCTSHGQAGHLFERSGDTWTITANTTDRDGEALLSDQTWDTAHATRSNWRFQVHLCAGPRTEAPCAPAVDVDAVHLEVTVHRGAAIPLMPPHFDAFDGERTRTLHEGTVREEAYSPPTAEPYAVARPGLVPWGTDRVDVRLSWSAANDPDLVLRHRTAAELPGDAWRVPAHVEECGSSCRDYRIPTTNATVDGPYAHRSSWAFAVFRTDAPDAGLVDHDIRMSIQAYESD